MHGPCPPSCTLKRTNALIVSQRKGPAVHGEATSQATVAGDRPSTVVRKPSAYVPHPSSSPNGTVTVAELSGMCVCGDVKRDSGFVVEHRLETGRLWVQTGDCRTGPTASLLDLSIQGWTGLDHPVVPGCSTAADHRSVRGRWVTSRGLSSPPT